MLVGGLILQTAGGQIPIDFPAEYKGEGEDLWRVDDEGVFSPGSYVVPFVLRRGSSYVVPVEWRGSEGVSVSLFVSDGEMQPARQVLRDYWYRAPRAPAGPR